MRVKIGVRIRVGRRDGIMGRIGISELDERRRDRVFLLIGMLNYCGVSTTTLMCLKVCT